MLASEIAPGPRIFLALPSSGKPISGKIWEQIKMRLQIFINGRPFELAVKLKLYDKKIILTVYQPFY